MRSERRTAEPLPLTDAYSLSIADACRVTAWSAKRVYDELRAGRVKSYTLGKRRYVDAQSLRARIAQLVAEAEPIRPEPKFRRQDGPAGDPPRRRRRRNLTTATH